MDGTLGGGGHAYEVLKRLGPKGRLIGIDQDADAIQAASGRLKEYGEKVTIVRSNYRNIKEVLSSLGIRKSGRDLPGPWRILLSAGYGDGRALPTGRNAPLDMRMDQRNEKKRPRISSMNTARWTVPDHP